MKRRCRIVAGLVTEIKGLEQADYVEISKGGVDVTESFQTGQPGLESHIWWRQGGHGNWLGNLARLRLPS